MFPVKPFDLDRRRSLLKTLDLTYDDDLPIVQRREEIADLIRHNQVVVVCGETGSGKSTQLPKICLEIGRGIAGMIGHTQPRRIAARSIAARIAEELNTPLGQAVGYEVRFDRKVGDTLVKLMTDGILLAESQSDKNFRQYDTIIIDEAHERSLNIDFLLGMMKRLLPHRHDLKLIITSATIDAKRFAEHFTDRRINGGKPVPSIEVSGRTYPVEIRYCSLEEFDEI
jgi:ATP-dependent helicase HrpA